MTITSKLHHLRLTILGPSGGGKGTQARLLAKELGLKHLEVGTILRRAEKDPRLGPALRRYVDRGKLAPDKLILPLIFTALKEIIPAGFILDGAPRTLFQAKAITRFLERENSPLDLAILLAVDDETILNRRRAIVAAGKVFQPGRNDDQEKILRRRLAFYHQKVAPVVAFYRQRHQLLVINGDRPIMPIHRDILQQLRRHFQ